MRSVNLTLATYEGDVSMASYGSVVSVVVQSGPSRIVSLQSVVPIGKKRKNHMSNSISVYILPM